MLLLYSFIKRMNLLRHHSYAIVLYGKNQEVILNLSVNLDLSLTPLILNSMIKSIFHQRLQGKLQDRISVHAVRNIDFIIHNIPVPELLYFQITAYMRNLLTDRYIIPPLAERRPEKSRQGGNEGDHFFLLSCFRHPYDSIQGVVQKVRINLCLQKFQLRIPKVELLLLNPLHKLTHIRNHLIEAFRQNGCLVRRIHLHPDIEVAKGNLLRDPAHAHDWSYHTSGNGKAYHYGSCCNHDQTDDSDFHRILLFLLQLISYGFQMVRFVMDVFLDRLLKDLSQYSDIVVEAYQILFIMSAFSSILRDFQHTLLQGVEGLKKSLYPPRIARRQSGLLQLGKTRPRLLQHLVRIAYILFLLNIFRNCRAYGNLIHSGINFLFEVDVVTVCQRDIFYDLIIGVTIVYHGYQQINDQNDKGNHNDSDHHVQFSVQLPVELECLH